MFRLFVQGFVRASSEIDEAAPHLLYYTLIPVSESGRLNLIMKMPTKMEVLKQVVCNELREQFKELGKPISHINGITLDSLIDKNGDTVTEDYLEDCYEGNFEISVKMKLPEDVNNPNVYSELPVNLKGRFTVSDYDNETKKFIVKIENPQLISETYETK